MQVLDGKTLGDIWLGKVVWWNDTAIQSLNPDLALPQQPILLACGNDTVAGVTHTFARALSLFNADFASAWNISTGLNYWRTFAGIAGRTSWMAPGDDQIQFVRVRRCVLPFHVHAVTKLKYDVCARITCVQHRTRHIA
jgi:phosphate transport system substrate-binding protein